MRYAYVIEFEIKDTISGEKLELPLDEVAEEIRLDMEGSRVEINAKLAGVRVETYYGKLPDCTLPFKGIVE